MQPLCSASAVQHGGKTPSTQIPNRQISARYHLEMPWGLGIGPSLEMLRFLSLEGQSSSLRKLMGDEHVYAGKIHQKYYQAGKSSKLHWKLFSVRQSLLAQCQIVAVWTSLLSLVLHYVNWYVKHSIEDILLNSIHWCIFLLNIYKYIYIFI